MVQASRVLTRGATTGIGETEICFAVLENYSAMVRMPFTWTKVYSIIHSAAMYGNCNIKLRFRIRSDCPDVRKQERNRTFGFQGCGFGFARTAAMYGNYNTKLDFRIRFTVRDFKDLKEVNWDLGLCWAGPRSAMASTLYRGPRA